MRLSITSVVCTSQRALVESCAAQVASLLQRHARVDVIVGSSAWERRLKARFAYAFVAGVSVDTLEHWLEAQWELWGDGTRLLDSRQRHLLLRPVLAALAGLQPSSKYLDQFASFVQDALSLDIPCPDASVAGALGAYRKSLQEAGLTEPSLVLGQIAAANTGRAVVFMGVDMTAVRHDRLARLLGDACELVLLTRDLPCQTIVGELASGAGTAGEGAIAPAGDSAVDEGDTGELAALRQRLFSAQKTPLACSGSFKAVEVLGAHAEDAVLTGLVRDAVDEGIPYNRIAVVFPTMAAVPASLLACFAKESLPVRCDLRAKVQQTAFGAAFLQFERLLAQEDDGYVNSIAFACSPYSGLSDETGRAFASTWRAQAGSSHEQRLKDLASGIKGRIGSKIWDDKLALVRPLLAEQDIAERVRLMFSNANAVSPDPKRIQDDAACANAILEYLELCGDLGCEPSLEDIAALDVTLARTTADADSHVLITGVSQLPQLDSVDYVVFARLDKDSYPMAAAPSPFDRYLADMGAQVQQSQALSQRLRLLDAIESARKGFACYRVAHNLEGEETCQSALWDELMAVYRTDADKDAPVQALPVALVESGFGRRVCEADVFASAAGPVLARVDAQRGSVIPEARDLLFPDFDTHNETFSPTAIEDYYRCPYRWFICRRIGANSIDKPFDQIAKGNLAHAVLERFYLNLREQGIERVTQDNLAQCLLVANESFDWQLAHEVERHRLNLTCDRDRQEVQVVCKQVLDLVVRDASFLPGFAPAFLELKLEDANGDPMTYAGVRVRGKVDRIDMDAKGRAVVIDYKLSGLASGYGFSAGQELPNRIQTDIYALLVERCLKAQGIDVTVVGSVYRSYAKNMLRGVYAAGIDWGPAEQMRPKLDTLPGQVSLQNYPDYLKAVERKVEGLVKRMREGDIAPRPLCTDACEYCLAAGFCQERRGA